MTRLTIMESGYRRSAKYSICQTCEKKFLHSKRRVQRYCSRDCVPKQSANLNVECSQCGKVFHKSPSSMKQSKSGLFFCSRKCKDEAQRIGGIEEIMPPHYGTSDGLTVYRNKFSDSELICSRCQYSEFLCSVHIHHIDNNRTHNDKSNLIPLCSNCHRALHLGHWDLKDIE